MAKQYIYAPANPIWMNEVKTFNAAYNTVPFDYQKGTIPYSQKVKFAIPTNLQVLSDWVPTLKIYKCDSPTVVATIRIIEIENCSTTSTLRNEIPPEPVLMIPFNTFTGVNDDIKMAG